MAPIALAEAFAAPPENTVNSSGLSSLSIESARSGGGIRKVPPPEREAPPIIVKSDAFTMDAAPRLRLSATMLKDARYLFELAAECFGRADLAEDELTRSDYLESGFALLGRAEAIRARASAAHRPGRPERPSLLRPSDSRTVH